MTSSTNLAALKYDTWTKRSLVLSCDLSRQSSCLVWQWMCYYPRVARQIFVSIFHGVSLSQYKCFRFRRRLTSSNNIVVTSCVFMQCRQCCAARCCCTHGYVSESVSQAEICYERTHGTVNEVAYLCRRFSLNIREAMERLCVCCVN